jgi:hypothetical protein
MSTTETDLRTIQRLIETLESDDAFERRQAIESLALLTQQRLDFAWRGSATERSEAVARWRKWLAREEKRRKSGALNIKAALELLQSVELPVSGASLQEALEKAFKDLPPEHKKALIAQMLAKVAAEAATSSAHETCERCKKRPATVKLTTRVDSGDYVQLELCEVCAAKAGA